jgi:hypothetical protein
MLFFLVRFAVFLVGQLADRVLSVPILYQFNHLGGGVVGFIKAAVSVWLVMSVLALLPAEPVQNWLKSPGMLQTMVTYMPQVYNRLGNLLPTWELLGR